MNSNTLLPSGSDSSSSNVSSSDTSLSDSASSGSSSSDTASPKSLIIKLKVPRATGNTRSSTRVKRKQRFSEPLTMVYLIAGKDGSNQKFGVHQECVCDYSPVLAAAFTGDYEEARTKTYTLQDACKPVLQLMVQWMYSQKFYLLPWQDEACSLEELDEEDQSLVELWVLADQLLIPKLQDAALGALLEKTKNTALYPTHCIQYVWENTAENSALRQWFLDICAYNINPLEIKDHVNNYPHEMLIQLFVKMAQSTNVRSLYLEDYTVPEN